MKHVMLTDSILLGLSRDPRVRQKIPAFRELFLSLSRGRRGCGRCQKKLRSSRKQVLAGLRQSIANLSAGGIRDLKKIVGAKNLTVYVRTSTGTKRIEL